MQRLLRAKSSELRHHPYYITLCIMDFLKNAVSGGHSTNNQGFSNSATTQYKSDPLDKAIDFVQDKVLHQGSQTNESAQEQAKDHKIHSGVEKLYQKATGKSVPGSTH